MTDFEQFFHAAIDPLCVADLAGELITVNAAWERLVGLPREQLQGRCLLDLVVPEDRERVAAEMASLASGRPNVQLDARVRDAGDAARWLRWTLLPDLGADRLFVVARDATSRLEEEAQVRHLANLVRSSNDAILGKTLDGTITSWNRAAERLYGYTAKEVLGKPVSILVPPDHDDDVPEILRRIRRGEPVESYQTVRQSKDGRRIDVSLTISPIHDAEGRLTGASAIARDVTMVRHLRELRRARTQLEAANRELEAFSYSVSHDLRAPLRAIDGFSQALVEDYGEGLDATAKDFLRRVRAAAQRMGELIDDLLALSRITRASIQRKPVALGGLAREILEQLRASEPARCVETVVASPLDVVGDRGLLRVALSNLLGNAWKFTRDREPARIELGAQERDGERVFYVRDNGAGFDMAYADQLFRPFSRLHAAHEFSGTGIGLATVQRALARLGGRVWAESAVGEGATFYFTVAEA